MNLKIYKIFMTVYVLMALLASPLRAADLQGAAEFQKQVMSALEILKTTPTGRPIALEILDATWLSIEPLLPNPAFEGKISFDSETGNATLLVLSFSDPSRLALTIAHEFQHAKDLRPLYVKWNKIEPQLSPEQVKKFSSYINIHNCLKSKTVEECRQENGDEAVEFGLTYHFSNEFRAHRLEMILSDEAPNTFRWSASRARVDENFVTNYVYEAYINSRYHLVVTSEKLNALAQKAKTYVSLLDLCEEFFPDIFVKSDQSIRSR